MSKKCYNPSHMRVVGENFCRACDKERKEEE